MEKVKWDILSNDDFACRQMATTRQCDHIARNIYVETLCFTLETNIILYANYILNRKKIH